RKMIFRSSAFIPGVITDKQLRSHFSALLRQFGYFGRSPRQIAEKVELVTLVQAERGPCRPDTYDIVAAIQLLTSFEEAKIIEPVFRVVVIKLIPVHHEMFHIGMPHPLKIGSLEKAVVERCQVVQHT